MDSPHLMILVFSAIAAVFIYVLNKKAAAAQAWSKCGLCLRCGYDLRASRGRCPECGESAFLRLDRAKLRRLFPGANREWRKFLPDGTEETVHVTTEREEARLLVLQLQARNIPAIQTNGDLKGQPFLVLHAVRVRADDEKLAREITRLFEIDESAKPEVDPSADSRP